MVYVNENIKNTIRVFPQQNRYGKHRYDMNENPEGLPRDFVNSVLREITPEFLSIYPEPDKFLEKYASYIGVERNNVVATNGSDMAIRYLLETFGEKGKDVVTVSPSFEMYWVNCSILGYHHVPIPYEPDLTLDIQKVLAAITEETRIVVLLNPNNPVGNVYTDDELKAVVEKAQTVNALVIIDEACHYFYKKTFLNFINMYDNIVILRTFSKLFSLAACRLGVIIGNPKLIHYVTNAKLTFDVNSIALLFGEKILDHPDIIENLIQIENAGKQYALSQLKEHGYDSRDCRGNFIFVKPKHDANEVARRLEQEKDILVHAYSNELLKDYLRVSVGSVTAMRFFLEGFFEIDR